jgi:two-component system invasion response regulator UvrY
MDINLEGMNGIVATPLVIEVSPLSKVLALSMHKQLNFVSQMMKAGAMGYVTKDSTAIELKMAILKIHGGDKYICENARQRLAENFLFGNKDEEKLTRREIEITDYVKKGNSSKNIAEALGIAVKTVEVHRSHILKKLKLKNSVSLVNYINIQQMQF